MSFVAAPPAAPAPPVADLVPGDGWYPALSIRLFRETMRLGTMIGDERARHALIGGMLSAAAELDRWRGAQEDAGIADLAGAIVHDKAGRPRPPHGAESVALVLWRRAVFAYAAADLVETHPDVSATGEGRDRITERALGGPELLRVATLAIRDLLGTPRTRVALL